MTQSNSGALGASKTTSYFFFWVNRLKRRQTVLALPNRLGRSIHAAPVRKSHTTVLKNNRLSRALTPQFIALSESNGATNAH